MYSSWLFVLLSVASVLGDSQYPGHHPPHMMMDHEPYQQQSYHQPAAYHQPEPYHGYYMDPYMMQHEQYAYQQPYHHMQYHQPSAAYHHPSPAYHQPAETYHQPAAAYHEPAQPYHQPAAAYHQPAQPYHQPAAAYHQPAAAYHQPAQPYHEPAAAYKHQNAVAPYQPPKTPKPAMKDEEPMYLGTFKNAKNEVEGDIFMLDDHTLYIQGFSFDGNAPDVYFWSDGVAIPYYTRTNPHMTKRVTKYQKEDIVLMLPKEKPTVKALKHFMIWCRQYGINFGEFDMSGMKL